MMFRTGMAGSMYDRGVKTLYTRSNIAFNCDILKEAFKRSDNEFEERVIETK